MCDGLTEMEEVLDALVLLFDFHAGPQRAAVVLKRRRAPRSC